MLPFIRRGAPVLMAALLAAACSDSSPSSPPVPANLGISGTVPGSAVAGSTVSPAVRVTDSSGNPVSGTTVSFAVTLGGGSVTTGSATSNSQGIATPGTWTLGTTAGANTLVASYGSLTPVTITVNGTAGAVASLVPQSTVTQAASAGAAVGTVPSVRAEDEHGNAVAGVTVTFAVTAGGGSVTGASAVTNASGIATVGSWTLGATAGENTLVASAPGGVTATFTAMATAGAVATMVKYAGDATTCPINRAGCVFSVRVTVDNGDPVQGETVIWSNGTATTVTTTTNSRGIATSTNIAPNNATGARTQVATLQSTGATVTFGYTLVNDAGFNIDVRYIGGTPSAAVQAAFNEARDRWEEVITGDLQNYQVTSDTAAATTCLIPNFDLDEVVDDLLILAVVDSIDGPSQILGSAGPCFIRPTNDLPIVGVMRLDSADLAVLAGNGNLKDVILHEMGHTLGFPTLWSPSFRNLLVGDSTSADPYYTGLRARPGFVIAGGTLVNAIGVPVENTGSSGTRLKHWRESVLSNELMTGYISGSNNPLSAITIGALMDVGYEVNFGAADTYLLPGVSGMHAASAPALELVELPMPAPQRVR